MENQHVIDSGRLVEARNEPGFFLITPEIRREWVKNGDPRAEIDIRIYLQRKAQENCTAGTDKPPQEEPSCR
jgi:hypothetical protein